MKQSLLRLWKECAGGSLIEYALLGALIAVGLAAGASALTHSVADSLSQAAAGMTSKSKSSLSPGQKIVSDPDDRQRLLPGSQAPSTETSELGRLAAALKDSASFKGSGARLYHTGAIAETAASRSWRYAKSLWSVASSGGIFRAQRAIFASWSSPAPRR